MEVLRYVGYTPIDIDKKFFSPENIKSIGDEASSYFKHWAVSFTDDVVRDLLLSNYTDYRPPQTDMFSKYLIDPVEGADKLTRVREITVNMLVSTARNEILTREYNNNLDIEIIKYAGELRATPKPKIRERRVPSMLFNMNY